MIFARRALQQRIDELRTTLGDDAVNALVKRLNTPGRDRLAAMWEVVVLHALSKLGTLRSELPLESGRRPDIAFAGTDFAFVADITTVSDEGVDNANPFDELQGLLSALAARLGLRAGGLDLSVRSKRIQTQRGEKTVLRLPDRKRLPELVRKEVEPHLRKQIAEGKRILKVDVNVEAASFQITIDPTKAPYSTGAYAAYDVPTIKDRNPLYGALKAKASQLRGAPGLAGIIVCDGDSKTFAERRGFHGLGIDEIAHEFFRQHTSIDFVLVLSIKQDDNLPFPGKIVDRQINASIGFRDGVIPQAATDLFNQMLVAFPRPIMMPVNAALRARESGYGLGHHGGYKMDGNRMKISSRAILEVFAGRKTIQEFNEMHGWRFQQEDVAGRTLPSPLERFFIEGRLPSSISIVKTDHNDSDDWIEIEFGPPDPAVSPFR